MDQLSGFQVKDFAKSLLKIYMYLKLSRNSKDTAILFVSSLWNAEDSVMGKNKLELEFFKSFLQH